MKNTSKSWNCKHFLFFSREQTRVLVWGPLYWCYPCCSMSSKSNPCWKMWQGKFGDQLQVPRLRLTSYWVHLMHWAVWISKELRALRVLGHFFWLWLQSLNKDFQHQLPQKLSSYLKHLTPQLALYSKPAALLQAAALQGLLLNSILLLLIQSLLWSNSMPWHWTYLGLFQYWEKLTHGPYKRNDCLKFNEIQARRGFRRCLLGLGIRDSDWEER